MSWFGVPYQDCPCRVRTCHDRSVSMSFRVDPCPCRSVSVRVKSRGGHFRRKKVPAASWIAATGLVKSRGGQFRRKKAPAASWLAATGLVKSRGGHFHRKKSAYGKLDSSNGACQVRFVSCQVESVSFCVTSGPCQFPSVSCHVNVEGLNSDIQC